MRVNYLLRADEVCKSNQICQISIFVSVSSEIEVKYHKKMQSMVEEEGKKRREEVNELEDRMKSRVVALMEEHDKALRGAEEYYANTQKKLLSDQKVLEVRGRY